MRASRSDTSEGELNAGDAEVVRCWTLRNLTAGDLTLGRLDGRDAPWVVPAFGSRRRRNDPRLEFDLARDEARGALDVIEPAAKSETSFVALYFYVWLVPAAALTLVFWEGTWSWVTAFLLLVAPLPFVAGSALHSHFEVVADVMVGLPGRILQAVTFLIVLTFCLAVPAVTLYFGANLESVVKDVFRGDASDPEYLRSSCAR